MNFPGESAESYQQTINQMRKAAELYDNIDFCFHCNQYTLYPGNKIYDERHNLAESRGFTFLNDGWWRVSKPDIRKRSEDCSASSSIRREYGNAVDFWNRDIARVQGLYYYKYSQKAFAFYQKKDMFEYLLLLFQSGYRQV